MNRSRTAQLTLVLGGFFGEDVALERLSTLDGSAAANLKALGSAFLGFHLGHDEIPVFSDTPEVPDPYQVCLDNPGMLGLQLFALRFTLHFAFPSGRFSGKALDYTGFFISCLTWIACETQASVS